MALLDPTVIDTAGLRDGHIPPRRYGTVRESLILTGSPVASDYFDMSNYSFASIWFDLTAGSVTELQWRTYHSWDETDWFERTAEEVSLTDVENAAPPDSMAVIGDFKRVKVVPVLGKFMRIEVWMAAGSVTGSLLEVIIAGV